MAIEVTDEHKLRRLLHTGTTKSSIVLRGGAKGVLGTDELTPLNSLASAGRVNLPLQHCLAAFRAGFADKRSVMLVLAGSLKIDCKQTKTAVYKALPEIVKSTEDFFEFIYYHRKVFRKRPHGMGRGMRKFISDWYLNQDPYDLALEVTRIRSRHHWSHADLITLAKVRSQDPAQAAILKAVVRGLKDAEQEFKDQPEAQPILEYMSCEKEINRCEDPDQAVLLIGKHSFDVDCLPTHLLSHAKVWEHAISRQPLRGVLKHLKAINKRGFLQSENSPVLVKVLESIKDPLALRASGLQPSDILAVMSQVESCWEKPKSNKRPTNFKPHPSLLVGLDKMMEASFVQVPKVPFSAIVFVDCRPNISKGCWGLYSLTAVKAMSLNILSLVKGGADVTVVFVNCDKQVKQIQVNASDSVGVLSKRIEENNSDIFAPISVLKWAREGGKRADLFISMTGSHTEVKRDDLWAEYESYKHTVYPNTKYIYMAHCCKSIVPPVANENDPNMMDICGWGPDSTRIIQGFVKDCF